MKQVLIRKAQPLVDETPAPISRENEALVQVRYSCISAGTEMSALEDASLPLYKKALREPGNVKKTLQTLRTQGLAKTVAQVRSRLDPTSPIGYSASGTVLEIGKQIKDIQQGDRVACAGAGIANHAEFIAVPRNLLVKVPESLPFETASTVTLGSIAMQGVRRADPKLGEFVAVIGLGILGQLTSQILKANGCKVIGIDIDQRRVDIALSLGIDKGLSTAEDNVVDEVIRFSGGYGVDCAIITASTKSSDVINQAMEICRKKGKVIIVGAVGLNLKREPFYSKELDVLISTSYGPGRYDQTYELEGRDYPYHYVRWTENRNMAEYLELLENRTLNIEPLIDRIYPVEEAPTAYKELQDGTGKPLIALLRYNEEPTLERKVIVHTNQISKDRINVAVVGTGAFATGVHLPNLKKLNKLYNIYAVVDRIGNIAKSQAQRYNASYATTEFEKVLQDEKVDMVIVTTRHNLHAPMAIEAAKAGKAIFTEKPMAFDQEQLAELVQVLEETKVAFTVGFNRRFSPYAQKIKEIVQDRLNPMIINCRVNAGFIPKEHWIHSDEGGGRNIGEACHIYDLFNFFVDSQIDSITASAIDPKTKQYGRNDNFIATIKYKDGSLCNLIYSALGTQEAPKEQMEIYFDGKVANLDDYKKLDFYGTKIRPLRSSIPQKGHCEELVTFAKSIKEGTGYPIPLWQLIQATEISLQAEGHIRSIH